LLALCCLLGAAVALCSILLEDIWRRRGTIDPLRYIALSLDILSLPPTAFQRTFWRHRFFPRIIWEAFRGRVQRPEDVFSVRPIDAVEPNFRLFQTAWEKCITRFHPRKRKPRSVSSDDRLVLLSETDENPDNLNAQQEVLDGSVPTVAFRPSAADRKKFAKTGSQDPSPKPETGHKVEKREHAVALLSALGSAFGGRLLVAWLFLLISTFLNYASPIFLGFLLRFLASTDRPDWEGYLIAVATILLSLAALVCDQRGFYRSLTLGISLRSVLTSAIYRKSLRLSSESRAKYTTGELLNLLSVDVNRIMESFMFSFLTWTAVIQFVLSFVLLWRQLGPATLAGIGCMFLLLPLNVILMWFTQKFEASEMKWKDKRLKCLGEVFGAIKVIKLYAWEKAFQTQADSIRTTELSRLVRVALGWGLGNVIWNLAPYVILLTTFVTFTWSLLLNGETGAVKSNATATMPMFLDPERIFVSVSLFNLLRAPLILLPWSLSAVIMAYVSVKRIGAFLLAPELDHNAVERSAKT
ncbi:ABC transporter transmembrane region, partial [Opisthorchis viverrini]